MALPHELSDVQLADDAHLGGAGVAKVGVVRPDGDPRVTVLWRRCGMRESIVSAMCWSRRFHEETRPRNIER